MPDWLKQKSDEERKAELKEILIERDRSSAFRWLREETLIMAELTVTQFLPELSEEYGIPKKFIEGVGYIIESLAEQLKNASVSEGQVPRIPFPFVKN